MKAFSILLLLLITTVSYGQCDQLNKVEENNTITTTTPDRINEYSISKIWFSDYNPPSSLIYLFLNSKGEHLEAEELTQKSKSNNVTFHFSDSSTLELRMIIDTEYDGNDIYNYQTVIYLNPKLLKELSSKDITHFELFGFSTELSERKSKKFRAYLNCMISE